MVGHPRRSARQLRAPALGRHAAARGHRARARARAGARHPRRADDGARRHRGAGDPRADPGAAAAARLRRALHHARPRAHAAVLGSGGGLLRGTAGRGRAGGGAAPRRRGIPTRRGSCAPSPRSAATRRSSASIPGAPPSLEHPPSGCRFHPRCDRAIGSLPRADPPELHRARPRATPPPVTCAASQHGARARLRSPRCR